MDFASLRKTYTRFVTNGLGLNADPEILRRVKVISLAGSAIKYRETTKSPLIFMLRIMA